MHVRPKIRLPETGNCDRQVDKPVHPCEINKAQRSLNGQPPTLSFTTASPVIDEECVRIQFLGNGDRVALSGPKSFWKSRERP